MYNLINAVTLVWLGVLGGVLLFSGKETVSGENLTVMGLLTLFILVLNVVKVGNQGEKNEKIGITAIISIILLFVALWILY